jgi:sugar phosphate isomerase/epimerase
MAATRTDGPKQEGGRVQCAGFTDEVSVDIDQQIAALRALGWRGIEMRLVGKGRHFDDVTDAEFEAIREKLDRAGIQIVAYGSQIANWARKISGRFEVDVAELRRIMPRMQRTGTQIVRIMSYPNDGWAEPEWRAEVMRRLRELSWMAEANGIILGHENCDGWAGQGPDATLACLAEVGSPALKLIFDTGNPVTYRQDAWAYYQAVREHIIHVHIKDYARDASAPGGHRAVFPGQGAGRVSDIVADLKRTGYDGWFSMEPHMLSVVHEGRDSSGVEDKAREVFLRYGKIFEELYRRA